MEHRRVLVDGQRRIGLSAVRVHDRYIGPTGIRGRGAVEIWLAVSLVRPDDVGHVHAVNGDDRIVRVGAVGCHGRYRTFCEGTGRTGHVDIRIAAPIILPDHIGLGRRLAVHGDRRMGLVAVGVGYLYRMRPGRAVRGGRYVDIPVALAVILPDEVKSPICTQGHVGIALVAGSGR